MKVEIVNPASKLRIYYFVIYIQGEPSYHCSASL